MTKKKAVKLRTSSTYGKIHQQAGEVILAKLMPTTKMIHLAFICALDPNVQDELATLIFNAYCVGIEEGKKC